MRRQFNSALRHHYTKNRTYGIIKSAYRRFYFMRTDKKAAVALRRNGKSYNEISRKFNIPKSTLSYWLRDIKISAELRDEISSKGRQKSVDILVKRNKNQTILAKRRSIKIRENAKKDFPSLMGNKLFLVGVALYWAEGYKKGAEGSKWKCFDFVNSDPEMVKMMMQFLRSVCKIDDKIMKVQLLAHKNLDIDEAIDFWSKLMKLPKSQFRKTCLSVSRSSKGKRNVNTLTKGTVHIRINKVDFFFKMIGWIDGLKSNIGTIAQW